jgi:SAM-dependent methyltransferase
MNQQDMRQAVLRQTKPGLDALVERMEFQEVRDCWCGGPLEAWLEEFPVYLACRRCGCKAVHYRPTPAGLELLYTSGYYWTEYQAIHSCPSVEERHERDLTDRVPQYLQWMRELALPPARTLEIGCGNGRLLREAAAAGYRAAGVEMDARVAAWVRQKTGLPVFAGSFPPPEDGAYDLVLALDVLEHVGDPVQFVREVRARLGPAGRAMVHTPVIDSPEAARQWRDMFNPLSHVWMHNSESFQALWESVGLRARVLGELFGMPCYGLAP